MVIPVMGTEIQGFIRKGTEMNQCQNCDKLWEDGEMDDVEKLSMRVAPGEPMPAGQCPDSDCGALCQPMPTVTPLNLANAFSKQLRQNITRSEFSEVIRRNKAQSDPSICHTHDFCDANQVILDAMKVIGLSGEYDADDANQHALITKAWDTAKAANFTEVTE